MSAELWMVMSPDDGPELYDTEKQARDAFDWLMDQLREESLTDGWHDEAESLAIYRCVPVVTTRLRVTCRAGDDTEDGERCRDAGWDYMAELDVVGVTDER